MGIFKLLDERKQLFKSGKVLFINELGRKVKEDRFNALVRFCNTEATPFSGNPLDWNFLNDSIVSDLFLTSSLGEILFSKIPCDPGLASKANKEKKLHFYKRADAPFVSSEEVWKASAPTLLTALQGLLVQEDPYSISAFQSRASLFMEQKKFPPAFLQRMLQYRQDCYSLPKDQRLYGSPAGFSLFGYTTLSDWFGDNYMRAVAGVMLYGASLAEKQGIKVDRKEARGLVRLKSKEAFEFSRTKLGYKGDYNEFFNSYLNHIGCSESVLVDLYREVLLFKKLNDLMKGCVPFDFDPLKDFLNWSKDSVELEVSYLHQDLMISDSKQLAAFEAYLDLVYKARSDVLELPVSFIPIGEVKKKDPRLVGRLYSVEYAVLSMEEIEAGITVKELRDWQRDPVNKSLLSHEFPQLLSCEIASLDKPLKKKVDSFSRHCLIRCNTQLIKEMLNESSLLKTTLILSPGQDPVLKGIIDGAELDQVLSSGDGIEGYSQDGRLFYRFKVLERANDEVILSYGEAKLRGVLAAHAEHYSERAEKIIGILKNRYPFENNPALRRISPLLEVCMKERSGSCLGYDLITKKLKVNRTDGFYDDFENVLRIASSTKISDVRIDPAIGPYYYRVISDPLLNHNGGVDKLLFLKEMLSDEVLRESFDKITSDFQKEGILSAILSLEVSKTQ